MKRWVAIAVLSLALIGMWGLSTIVQGNLEKDVEFWKRQFNEANAELNAPQALVQIREMDFEWNDGDGKIVGEVKNYGTVDAINVYVRVKSYKGQMVGFGDFVWVDYLRAGENKHFELKVSKPYCGDEHIPQIELGYKTIGEYGREWKSQIMGR